MQKDLKEKLHIFFEEEFAAPMLKKIQSGHKLSKFSVNPFILTALSSGILGKPNSVNIAKSLLYPRIFGTSISTTFGDKMQKLCIKLLGARASNAPGMDIEFTDKTTGNELIIQLKSGPNTLNAGDVKPVIDEMNSAYRLLRQNHVNEMPIFAMGVIYGSMDQISGHYKKIALSSVGGQLDIPILIGSDFWLRLTGDEHFYDDMIQIFFDLFEKHDYSKILEADITALAKEIDAAYFPNGKLNFIQ